MSNDSLERADPRLRVALVLERRILMSAAAGLAIVCVVVLAVSDLGAGAWVRAAGLALTAVGSALLAVEAWRPRLRGSTSINAEAGETHLQAARRHTWYVLIAVVGLGLLAVGVGLDAGGLVLTLLIVVAVLAVLGVVVALRRPLRVILDMKGVAVRHPWGTRSIGWDTLTEVRPGRPTPARPVLAAAPGQRSLLAATRHLTVTPDALATVVLHYRDTVADRSELGTVASQDRIDVERDAARDR